MKVTLVVHPPTQLGADATPAIEMSCGTRTSLFSSVTVTEAPARAVIRRCTNDSPDAVMVVETGPDGPGGGPPGPGPGLLGLG